MKRCTTCHKCKAEVIDDATRKSVRAACWLKKYPNG